MIQVFGGGVGGAWARFSMSVDGLARSPEDRGKILGEEMITSMLAQWP